MSTQTLAEKNFESQAVDVELLSEKDRQELITADTVSIASGTTLGADLSFQPVKSLHVNTKGIGALRLPLPQKDLETTVHNFDESVAYTSTRYKRSSGNCVLTDAEGRQLIGTTYFFGPGKDPVLTRLDTGGGSDNEIKTLSKWTSRSQKFLLPDGREFDWEYKKEKGFGKGGKKGTALVLKMQGKRIAALIGNEETRTPGSKACSAGNGGELALSEEVGGKEGVSEEVVIATCILMLKKEIDRRRAVQFMMLTAAASGGP